MQHRFLLYLFLSHISIVTYSMDSLSIVEVVPDDTIIYSIAPLLNLLKRGRFRRTNKKYYKGIYSQEKLYEEYAQAKEKNEIGKMIELQKRGIVEAHELVYKLFINSEEGLLNKVWHRYRNNIGISFYMYSEDVFLHGVTLNNEKFVEWLLEKVNPPFKSDMLGRIIDFSKKLEINNVTKLLQKYCTQENIYNEYYFAKSFGSLSAY